MKKICGLLFFVLLLNGCDDGDLTYEDIDFDDITQITRCSNSNIVYKTNESDALIINFANASASLTNVPTTEGNPRIYPISATTNKVIFRSYNGTIPANFFCETIPPATPVVTREWTAISGDIIISTAITKIANSELPGGEKISKYLHTITFRNITFQKEDGTTQFYDVFNFGVYSQNNPAPLAFDFSNNLAKCDSSGRIYNYLGTEALTLDNIAPALLDTSVLGTPKTGLIGSTTNKLTFTLFTGGTGTLTPGYFCTAIPPATPTALQTWIGADGVADVSGIVEVVTSTSGSGFIHTIRLKKVTLTSTYGSFVLADDYLLGELIL